MRLDRFVLLSYAGFAKIVKKHDRLTGLCTRPWLLARLAGGELMRARFDRVVVSLSDAYSAVRARRAGGAPDGGAAWVPPSDFERATTKYWVAPEDVLAVKVRPACCAAGTRAHHDAPSRAPLRRWRW